MDRDDDFEKILAPEGDVMNSKQSRAIEIHTDRNKMIFQKLAYDSDNEA